jgi:peptide/nickel transport system substrate-binding protein
MDTMHTIRKPFRLIALLALLAALTVIPMTAGAQAPTPDEDTVVVGILAEPVSLDPARVANFNIMAHLFGQLYELAQATGEISPYLANSYSISEDGTEWTFTLNEGLTCHDGEPLTAEDVAYSWDRMADPENGFTGNSAGFVVPSLQFQGTRVEDDLNVTLIFGGTQNESLRLGLISEVFIHCKDSYEAMTLDEAARNPVGSGPYMFGEWVTGDYITTYRNENFTLRETYIPEIVWRIFPEQATAIAEVITGNVDVIKGIGAAQVEPVNSSGVASIVSYTSTIRAYVGFQMGEGKPWSDTVGGQAIKETPVRVALQYAIDVNAICNQLLAAECERATGPVNPPNDNPDLEPYPYDPAMAEQLLDEAGYPRGENGVRFELTLMARNIPGAVGSEVAQAIAQFLSDVGVQTEVEFLEQATFVEELIAHNLGPLYIVTTGGAAWSAQYDLADFPAPDGETNYTDWANEEFFALEASLPSLVNDPEAERAAELEMLRIFYEDPPWLLMYFSPTLEAVSNRLDYTPRIDTFFTIYNVKLKES